MNMQKDALSELAFIKKTMASAGRYGTAGLIAPMGCVVTCLSSGPAERAAVTAIDRPEVSLLGIGFGLVHIVFGIIRLVKERVS